MLPSASATGSFPVSSGSIASVISVTVRPRSDAPQPT
jgi:hypothetical protein